MPGMDRYSEKERRKQRRRNHKERDLRKRGSLKYWDNELGRISGYDTRDEG